MTATTLFTTYTTFNLLIALSFILVGIIAIGWRATGRRPPPQTELRLHYVTFATVLMVMTIYPFMPKREVFVPLVKVWTAQSSHSFAADYVEHQSKGYLSLSSHVPAMIDVDLVMQALGLVVSLFLLASLWRVSRDIFWLIQLQRRSYQQRRFGSVRIMVSPEIQVPFSFWFPGRKVVIMPEALLGKLEYRMAMLHELQHHRQGDTKSVFLILGFRILFFLNPAAHLWDRKITELQEMTCDDQLIRRRKVESLAYARCLIDIAKVAGQRQPWLATGFHFQIHGSILKRRIQNMLSAKESEPGWRSLWLFIPIIIFSLAAAAYATKSLIQDRRVTMAQAQEMVRVAQGNDGFPLEANDLVLKWLNFYIGTPDGREHMRKALARMQTYRPLVESKLSEYKVPSELLAIPITESGYQNLTQDNQVGHGAGIWMFIISTAKVYGMRVDGPFDDRRIPDIETDAAMRYLSNNKSLLKDWRLAVLGYNSGEQYIQALVKKMGTSDPWQLIRKGMSGDENKNYLPRVMAAVLIMRNPGVVR